MTAKLVSVNVAKPRSVAWRGFGENLTTAGCLEDAVRIGDRFRIGSAEGDFLAILTGG